MTQFENNNFRDVLLNRHSVRHFDKTVKIPREELREMIKETITAPSACNLQAWQFIVVDTDEGKKKLHEFYMPFNNPQIDTSSAIIQIFGNTLAFKKYRALWDHMYVPVMGIAIGKPDTSVQELKSVRYPVDDILKFE